MSTQKDQGNVVRGLKAAINNPRVSEEAKQRDIERLQEMGEYEVEAPAQEDSEHNNRVLGGYKATLSNPRTSEAAKEHAQQVLEESGQA
ncbi:hypothetical protein EST38_g8194 [Candolleomyces aberdarensis]|uniref:Conidiation protein 6 n=1 Tax=Candolleomyces aberdarensis TaxID=2316362 RepID=A0A4Q2DD73_9AGAR|nr:hypothetical protein EST38_g8194 [Candolleomyces aberdarensis]